MLTFNLKILGQFTHVQLCLIEQSLDELMACQSASIYLLVSLIDGACHHCYKMLMDEAQPINPLTTVVGLSLLSLSSLFCWLFVIPPQVKETYMSEIHQNARHYMGYRSIYIYHPQIEYIKRGGLELVYRYDEDSATNTPPHDRECTTNKVILHQWKQWDMLQLPPFYGLSNGVCVVLWYG